MVKNQEYFGKIAYDQKIAENYEKDRIVEDLWPKEQLFIKNYVAELEDSVTLLDIPVGTGRFLEFYNRFKVIGIDISSEMLKESSNKINEMNGTNIELQVGDITDLKFKSASIDYTICWRLFHLLPDYVMIRAISELCRVSKKEIVIQTYDTKAIGRFLEFKIILFKFFTKLRKERKPVNSNEPWSHITSYPHDEKLILNSFRKNGFILSSKDTIDTYKNEPVNVYMFKRL